MVKDAELHGAIDHSGHIAPHAHSQKRGQSGDDGCHQNAGRKNDGLLVNQELSAAPTGDEGDYPLLDILGFAKLGRFQSGAGGKFGRSVESVGEDLDKEGRKNLADDHEDLGDEAEPIDGFVALN